MVENFRNCAKFYIDDVVALIIGHCIEHKRPTIQKVSLICESPFSHLTYVDGGTSIAALPELVRGERHGV
jgi:hypothetical protein